MKKILCTLLCICITLSLASCWHQKPNTGSTLPSTPNTSSPTDSTTQTTPPVVQIPPLNVVSISLPLIHETTLAADGTELFRYTFQDVALNIADANIAKIITLDLLQRMDSNSSTAVSLESQATKDYVPGADWTPYLYEVIYTPRRMDETVLSLSGAHLSFDGSSQSSTSMSSATYDLVSGKFLAISDILSDTDGASASLCGKLITQLDKIAKDKSLFSSYQATIAASFATDLNRYYAWFFTDEGICFYFSPYEIAPNSAGTIQVTVPYSELVDILKDEYFPAEKPAIAGTLSSGWFDEVDLNNFTHFAELLDDPDARRCLLWVDTVIYDVRLEQGHWDTATNQFVTDSTVFTSNCIAEADALMLRCKLSDTTPTLLLHYVSNGVENSCYITKDHQTGAVVLTSLS